MDASSIILAFLSTYLVLIIAIWLVIIIGKWRVFKKANKPGWASIVPFYNDYVEYLLFWGNGWLFVVPILLGILSPIPIIGQIAWLLIVLIKCIHRYKQAESFGQGIGFTIGLILLKPIFICILGFGKAYEYKGVALDGFSYNELKEKFDKANNKDVKYEQPKDEDESNMKYKDPNN